MLFLFSRVEMLFLFSHVDDFKIIKQLRKKCILHVFIVLFTGLHTKQNDNEKKFKPSWIALRSLL